VSHTRLNIYLHREHAKRLAALAQMQRVSKSSLVATALTWFLSPEGGQAREATIVRRLDRLAHQFERLERDQTIQIEALALFIRHQLSVTAPIPEAQLQAARAQGRVRFEQFVDQLARHLQRGGSMVRDVWQEIAPDTAGQGAGPGSDGNGSPPEEHPS
jgi:predicted transcriptional regulator